MCSVIKARFCFDDSKLEVGVGWVFGLKFEVLSLLLRGVRGLIAEEGMGDVSELEYLGDSRFVERV